MGRAARPTRKFIESFDEQRERPQRQTRFARTERHRHTKTMAETSFLFTSESVNEGHPDKLADQVSDAVLDACLEQDPASKVACETATKTGMIMIFGEITTKAKVDYEAVVRKAAREIGFTSADVGLDCDTMKVL